MYINNSNSGVAFIMSTQLFNTEIRDSDLLAFIEEHSKFQPGLPNSKIERVERVKQKFINVKKGLQKEHVRRSKALQLHNGDLCATLKTLGYHNSSCRGRVPIGECGCVRWPDGTGPGPAWISPCLDYLAVKRWPEASEQVKQEQRRKNFERTRDVSILYQHCQRFIEMDKVHVQEQESCKRGRQVSTGTKRPAEETDTQSVCSSKNRAVDGEHRESECNVFNETVDERIQGSSNKNEWNIMKTPKHITIQD